MSSKVKCLDCPNEFVPRKAGKKQKFCSHNCCTRFNMRKELLDKPEQVRQRRKAFRKNNPDSVRNSELKKLYGITLEQRNALSEKQDHKCAICKQPGKLVVDHCHVTKKVRGLVHSNCNLALGLLKDSPEAVLNAASYLALGGI